MLSTTRIFRLCLALVITVTLSLAGVQPSLAQSQSSSIPKPVEGNVVQSYADLPLLFIENQGQLDISGQSRHSSVNIIDRRSYT